MTIKTVAVIGAGVMGASIAAHISNAGMTVYLLDVVPKTAKGEIKNRNIIAETARQKLLKTQPPVLMDLSNARFIKTGNIEDHLDWLAQVDWVIEAVVEDLSIKKRLYQKLLTVCHANTIISSNTSTIPLHQLVEQLPTDFQSRFLITHFFNPPRYMRLLELVSSPATDPEKVRAIKNFADQKLGKGCVDCKDSIGFIANRIGIYWVQCGLLEALNRGLRVEEVDALMSEPFGIPKTGIFGLLDLVGLDLIPHILESMKQLPRGDDFHRINQIPDLFKQMIADGYTGRKGKGGFYRLKITHGQRIKESIDLQTGQYQTSQKPILAGLNIARKEGLAAFLSANDPFSQYAWAVMSKTLSYVAGLIPEIADDISAVDEAMRLGYNWQYGPFELLDRIGTDWFIKRIEKEGKKVPDGLTRQTFYRTNNGLHEYRQLSGDYTPIVRAEGVVLLADIKLKKPAVLENAVASLWDVGDGIACFELHSKMNTFNPDILTLLQQSLKKVASDFTALVIHNEADNFSAGANLGLLVNAIEQSDWEGVTRLIKQGQQTFMALKYAPFPVVAAPSGLALGGGCEILLHCDAIVAHAELYTGLVEVGVGLVPGWGGCKEYLGRCLSVEPSGPIPPVVRAFEIIGQAKISQSALEAKQLGFLRSDDTIVMNKSRLLAHAKAKALMLSQQYNPPEPMEYILPGKTAKLLLTLSVRGLRALERVSAYDVQIADYLATVLSGADGDISKPLSEQAMLALECQVFGEIVKQQGTLDRLRHMLKTGKPLRN